MKIRITDPEIIRKQERDLFEVISENLDWEALSKIFRARHRLAKITGMASRQGDFVALKDAVAYRLDFDVQAVLGVVFDRSGNYLDVEAEILEPPRPASAVAADENAASPPGPERGKTAKPPQVETEPDTISLHQIISNRSEMILDPARRETPFPKPPPGQKISKIATELADMISDINGKKKR
jgi:hypothetical protein